jgi:hypothetical protein
MTASEARAAALAAAQRQGWSQDDLNVTPPFPEHWPLNPAMRVVFYLWRTRALPTGRVAYDVYSPLFRIAVNRNGVAEATAREEFVVAGDVELWEPPESLAVAADALLRGDFASARAAYREWFAWHELAMIIAEEHREFVAWLGATSNAS